MLIEAPDNVCDDPASPGKRDPAIEAKFILSALDAAGPLAVERRSACRVRYRVEAVLRLNIDLPQDVPRRVYTRDLTPSGLGFISPVWFPLSCGGTLHLPAPGGSVDTIPCKVIRRQEMIQGWFDGAVSFKETSKKRLEIRCGPKSVMVGPPTVDT